MPGGRVDRSRLLDLFPVQEPGSGEFISLRHLPQCCASKGTGQLRNISEDEL